MEDNTNSKKECKVCHNKALNNSKYCTTCWAVASQNGTTQNLIDDDRHN